MAAVLLLLWVAWNLRASWVPSWWVIGMAAVHVIAAIGLWYRRRWAWGTALLLQVALPLLGLLVSARLIGDARWWLQQLPHVVIAVLLLLPEGRRSRATLREPGFEPGDTTPVK
ncbi:hypothetical protein WG902_21225 [Ramlibacter sp. PS3R-8]|uniref:hypothetical protein n=1 Tax=Ramlibacter sp. PS3R-8 TaxID=3133437 RepID=UPI0030A1ADC3